MTSKNLEEYNPTKSNIKAFISFNSKDICQANFIYHILKYYQIKSFFSPFHCEKGKIYSKEIKKNLKESDVLLVVVTKNTHLSSWVTKEIAIFESKKENVEIIPLIFEQANLGDISPGLSKYQYIDFSDWTTGFTELFKKFGIKFLEKQFEVKTYNKRTLKDRRSEERINLRIQTTFWNYYSRIYNLDMKDEVKLDERGYYYFYRSLLPGAKKYFYYDNFGNLFNYKYVLNLYAEKAWLFFRFYSQNKYAKAIDLTILLANLITDNYTVKWIDRRN